MSESLRFDRFEIHPSARVLLVDGSVTSLGARTFDLLVCLIEHRERVVTKEELLAKVWPGQVVEENNLSVHVSALRKVLGRSAIATVSGRGYRFTANVRAGTAAAFRAASATAVERPSIAVLPLDVLADDPRIGYFAQGLVEDVIALLARVPGFVLIAYASSSLYRGSPAGMSQVGRELGVRFIVRGSVRPRPGALRVSLQLVEVASAQILWSAHFDTQSDAPDDAQERIARGIMSELEPELTRAEIARIRRQRPDNLDAWAHYHAALAALSTKGWSAEALNEARDELRRSTALDPDFGLGHAQYALLTILEANIGMVSETPALRAEVQASAERAIALDGGSSEVLGYAGCALCDLGQYRRGLEIVRSALELNPSNAQAHVAMGAGLALDGRLDEGIRRLQEGMQISPRDRRQGFWRWLLGCFLLRLERMDEALAEARISARVDPRFHLAHVLQAACLDRLGAADDAAAALASARLCRPGLTVEEVTKTHGRRIGGNLARLWSRATPL